MPRFELHLVEIAFEPPPFHTVMRANLYRFKVLTFSVHEEHMGMLYRNVCLKLAALEADRLAFTLRHNKPCTGVLLKRRTRCRFWLPTRKSLEPAEFWLFFSRAVYGLLNIEYTAIGRAHIQYGRTPLQSTPHADGRARLGYRCVDRQTICHSLVEVARELYGGLVSDLVLHRHHCWYSATH